MRSSLRVVAGFAASLALLGVVPQSCRAQAKPSEFQVKAVYLFNFSRFVAWPAQPSGSSSVFPICVLGKDPFGAILDATLAGETVAGKTVVARRLTLAQEAAGCRVVFISTSEESRLKDVLAALDKSSVLTVSDIERFAQRGGMIQFVLQGDRVRFEVNPASAAEAGLTLSSDLLKVAVAVRKNAPPGG
jgi:YfiR/HmsC-like